MKKILIVLGVLAFLLLMAFLLFKDKYKRLQFARKMFSGVEQVERFRSMEQYFPTRVIQPGATPSLFKRATEIDLPETYSYKGQTKNTQQLLDETDITGLMVLKQDTILYESYFRGNTETSHTIGWSVTKSFVSALMGIAIEEGHIKNIQEKAVDYLPELAGSAYAEVTIKNLLQMSSGVSWNEDYSDPDSDINRFGRTLALGGSFEDFAKTLSSDKPQGTYNRYNSSDTQVLGMIISAATNRSLSDYLQEKIWEPLGMEYPAWWVIDDQGIEFAAGGLSASLRDYARLGLLYLNNGNWKGQQIVPARWIKQTLTPDAPHLQPGVNPNSNNEYGYGYQWWILDGAENEFSAIGIYNQLVYVNPTHNIIIAKSAANSSYGLTDEESSYREIENFELMRAIVDQVKGQ